nr:hypothetical protein [Tanacetum cinerariifolium]
MVRGANSHVRILHSASVIGKFRGQINAGSPGVDSSSLTTLGGRKDPDLRNITSTSFSALKVMPIVKLSKRSKTGIVGVVLEEDPSSSWEATENTIERKTAPQHSSLASVSQIFFSEEAGSFSGGIFSARLLIAFTTSICLDVLCDGFFFIMGNNQAVWGDACDKKAMHGCPQIKKASVMKTFFCPTGNGGSSCIGKTCGIGLIKWTPKSESLSSESISESSSDERSEYLSSHAVPRRTSRVLVEVTTSAMDCDSCKKDWGGCGSNETPTKGVDGNLHRSSTREPLSGR